MHQCPIMLSIYVWKRLHDDASLGTFFVWIPFVFLRNISLFFIVVIVILRTLRGHEIFKFTFKSWTCTEKRDNEQKSLKLDCGREVSSEVNSYSTHLPIAAFTAPQGHNCFEYCTYKHRHALPQMGEHSRPLSRENIWALWLFFYSVHWWKRVIMYSLKAETERKAAQTDSAVTQMLPLEKSLLFSNH